MIAFADVQRHLGNTGLFIIKWPWLLSVLLCIPIYALYIANFTGLPSGVSGTGFLQYDQPYYMANARAYSNGGNFSLTYGLPFSVDPNTPRIYFQPLTAVLGFVLYLTGSDPGVLYMIAGIILAICCGRLIIAWYRAAVVETDWAAAFGLICCFWGGGLLVVGGIIRTLVSGQIAAELFRYDPAGGWWMLNFGRNLVYTTEAFYHLVFLGALLLWLGSRYMPAFFCAVILSASHPFSGIQLILVLGAASVVRWALESSPAARPLLWFIIGIAVLGLIHIYYYLYFLGAVSDEHRILQDQWKLDWSVPWTTYILSTVLLWPFVAVALARQWRQNGRFTDQQILLMAVWAVTFALGHHDLVIKPVQPIHYLHGYDWTALFLLGAPIFVEMIRGLRLQRVGLALPLLVVAVFLSDNVAWFGEQLTLPMSRGQQLGFTIDSAERAVFDRFAEPKFRGCVVLSQDEKLGYLLLTYTPLRSFYSHEWNTPGASMRKTELDEFFSNGKEPSILFGRCILAVVVTSEARNLGYLLSLSGYENVFTEQNLSVYAKGLGPTKGRFD